MGVPSSSIRPSVVLREPPRGRAGHTLVEMLAALLVVTLVGGVAISCFTLTARLLSNSSGGLDLRQLRMELTYALRDELACARAVQADETGALKSYERAVDASGLQVERRRLYADADGVVVVEAAGGEAEPLVAAESYHAGSARLAAALEVAVVPYDEASATGGCLRVRLSLRNAGDAAAEPLAVDEFDVEPLAGPLALEAAP